MDATRAIQIAVARADLIVSRARASPLWIFVAALAVGGLLWGIIKTIRRKTT